MSVDERHPPRLPTIADRRTCDDGVASCGEPPRRSISFIVATRNEAGAIEACVRSLQSQDYPDDLIEIAVVDGGSTDATRAIVGAIAERDRRVRLLDNDKVIAASAFNRGIENSSGEIVSLVSAHSVVDRNYSRFLVEAFETSGAWLVGGRMVADVDGGPSQSAAIGRALSSPVGVGNAVFHYSSTPRWVDTAFPGAYRRDLFDRIGTFDERLVRNQDDDFHFRARRAGHRMWFDPRLECAYRPRRTLSALARQYYEYGYWRAVTAVKHRGVASVRQLAPASLVGSLTALVVLSPGRARAQRLLQIESGAYLAVVFASQLTPGDDAPIRTRIGSAVAVIGMHVAYGAGTWLGLPRGLRLLRSAPPALRHPQ